MGGLRPLSLDLIGKSDSLSWYWSFFETPSILHHVFHTNNTAAGDNRPRTIRANQAGIIKIMSNISDCQDLLYISKTYRGRIHRGLATTQVEVKYLSRTR
jgi:hypothetical protein